MYMNVRNLCNRNNYLILFKIKSFDSKREHRLKRPLCELCESGDLGWSS